MIRIQKAEFHYSSGFSLSIDALQIDAGEQCSVMGPSGCGKTTLLKLVAGIQTVHSGLLETEDRELRHLPENARRHFRISRIGMIFQRFELLDYLNVLENVLLPYQINSGLRVDKNARERGRELLDTVGLADKEKRNVESLSEGERQRLSICRALVTQPPLLLADEPTASLDEHNAQTIVQLLISIAAERQATLIVVTHDPDVASHFPRSISIQGGHLK